MELKLKLKKLPIHHASDIYKIMQLVLKREKKLHKDREHCWIIALNSSSCIINIELICIGDAMETNVIKPMEVLSIPLQKRATGIIIVHNHPSGDLRPSKGDKDTTDRLIQACKLMETPVLDHVIITEYSFYSFKDSGLLDRLEASNKYILPYELEEQYHEEMMEEIQKIEKKHKKQIDESLKNGESIGLQKGRQKGEYLKAIEISKEMLSEGFDIVKIARITGLSEQEIKNLGKNKD
ncbi:JAB domain-containing protein [Cardinium endosymbiont of Culicoides punctatus]|uniref:JAB domain-containing protein n=1 Tax=Cardinium endosymbiont of Culicoides punctatus TaxID=2304601 RepID=UPI001059171E|nr:JAB domain-containing protein [Cardinium endosymbiont of Culicoides punctatus]TDG94536.1 hypothetical protein CCPUN_07930 [Cardinium endosymbiont of Culicoides punctatus]